MVLNPHSQRTEFSRNSHRWRCNNKEIRLEIFRSPDYTVFPYNQGTPVYSSRNLFVILGIIVKICLKGTGTPVKNC